MFESAEITLGASVLWLAQVRGRTALVFSGSQFFTALIAGVLLAFAFQLLFTNLGVAAWISTQGKSSNSSSDDNNRKSISFGTTIRQVSVKLGLATLVSVTLALFIACMLAVRLGLFVSPVSGAIVGLTIWATFFALLVWLSSNRLSSFIGSVTNAATSGLQAILGTATAAIGTKAASKQVVATAEAAAAAVSRELGNAIKPQSLRKELEGYLGRIKSPEVDTDKIAADFERLLERENLPEIGVHLRQFDHQTFRNLIGNRSDLAEKDLDRIAKRLETIWQQKIAQRPKSKDHLADFKNYLQSATREQLLGKDFDDKLDTLVKEKDQNRSSTGTNPVSEALTLGVNSLIGLIMGRSDLSEFDIDKITAQMQQLKGHLGEQTDKIATGVGIKDSPSLLKTDIENYLLNIYPWKIGQENAQREFRDILYNPEDAPEIVAADLRQIDRAYFAELLGRTNIYNQTKIESISQLLERIRLEALDEVEAAIEQKKAIATLTKAEDYLLHTAKENLTPAQIQLKFSSIFLDSDLDYQQLSEHLNQFERSAWETIFTKRQDIPASETSNLITELEIAKERVLREAQEEQASAQLKVEVQWQRVQSYLREASKEQLSPQALQKELKLVLSDRNIEGATRRARKTLFERDTLMSLLVQRRDLSREQIDRTLNEVEKIWLTVQHEPTKVVVQVQDQYEQASSAIAEYLRNTGREELNPEGIERDLTKLLEDPKTGFKAITNRLAQMDRDTLVQLLSQREDLSQEQVNQTIDQVQATLGNIAKTPRLLAKQTQEKVESFQETVADYLRSTDKEELNPEGIKRDVQLLLNNPRAGMGNLQERLSHFDRDTLVVLLSQRDDISPEDVNRIIDEILVIREQMLERLKTIQKILDRVLIKVRDYFRSLSLPELNYQGIKNDLDNLFNDPKAGFEALRDRFSHFDRDTLINILSSRDDISKADVERIVSQVETTRDRLLQKSERIQLEAKLRVEEVKRQAQRQAEEARKAAAAASWWLFFTAFISAIASAGAGALGAID